MSSINIIQPECRTCNDDAGHQPVYDFDGSIYFDFVITFPAAGSIFNSLPQAVLGGCTVMMFGSIMYEGIKMLKECEFDDRTMVIVSLAFAIGVGLTQTSGKLLQCIST